MVRRTITLFVVVLGVGYVGNVSAQQADTWNVRAADERERKIVERYTQVLLKHPDRVLLVRRLVARVGSGPGLDQVIRKVERAASRDADRAEPRILLGHLLRERGRQADAMTAYREAVAVEPDDARARAALGMAYVDAGQPDRARAALERALELQDSDRERRELLRRLSDLAIAGERPGEAVAWFQRLVAERPKDGDLQVEYAELLIRARRFGAAVKAYEHALEQVGRNGKKRAVLLRDLGSLHRRLHDPVAAADHYRRALRLVARGNWMRRELLTRLVDVHREMNRLPEIYEELEREWGRPDYTQSMQLASLADEVGLSAEATRWLQRAARLDRRALEPRTQLIARLEMGGDHDRVRAIYDEILRIRPDDVIHRMELAEWVYFRREKPKRAMEMLRQAEERWKGDPDALVEIARTWNRFGVAAEALRLHRAIAEVEPLHVHNLEAWGELQAKLGDVEEAKSIWGRLLETDLTDIRARLRLADLLLRVGEADAAIEHLEAVVDTHPDVADLHQRLATTYERARRFDDALSEWERLFFDWGVDHAARRIVAIVDRTYDVDALARWETRWRDEESLRVGIVTARMREVLREHDPGPIAIAETIADRDPASLRGPDRLAWIEAVRMLVDHHAADDPQAAIAWLRTLGEAAGEQRIPTAQRIVDIAFTMDPDVAREHFEYAVKVAPNDPHVRAQTGNFFGTNGDGERAIEHLTRAIELGPGGFEPYFDLVHYLTEAGRPGDARDVLLKVVSRDRSGKAAVSAALAALDLCGSDADVTALEGRVRQLRGRIPAEEFRTIMIGVYQYLFVYADQSEAAFEALGDEAFPIVVDAVQSRRTDVRARASMLTRLYDPSAVVARAMRSWTAEPNEEMTWLLTRTGDRHAAEMLSEALGSDDETVRHMAMLGLARVAGRESIRPLLAAVEPEQPAPTRALAAMILGGVSGPDVVARLGELATADPSEEVRVSATWALGRAGTPRSAVLLRGLLRDPVDRVAGTASWSLASMHSDDGVRALFEAYWSPSDEARAEAERGLQLAVSTDHRWWDPGEEAAEAPDPVILMRRALREAMVIVEPVPIARSLRAHPATVARVAETCLDRDERRQRVLDDLVRIADEASEQDHTAVAKVVRELRPRLRKFARRSEPPVMQSAAMLLPHAGEPDDVEVVVAAAGKLRSADGARVLERLSRYPWPAVRRPLVEAARSDSPKRRRASFQAIQRSDHAAADAEVVDLVERAVHESDPDVRVAAIETLGALGHDASTDMLVAMFEETDYRTRVAILGSLRSMGTKRSAAAARQLLVVPIRRPCEGDPDDLEDLLTDSCTGGFDVLDF